MLSRTGVRQTDPPVILAPPPSFLCSLRHSCALSVIPAPCPSFLRRQESMRSVGVKGTPNVRRRPITRGALGAGVGRRADRGSSHGWAVAWIPASAGMTEGAGVTEGGGRDGRGVYDGRGGCGRPVPPLRHSCAPLRHSCAPLRHSCAGRNPCGLGGARALPMFDGARSPAARWELGWAVGRIEARRTVGRSHGFLPVQE